MTSEEREELLADEWLIVRNSGEIPEITFHSSLYYLQEDPEGPVLQLTADEIVVLKEAALQRYQEIILRDIDLANYHKSLYRGVKRTIYNWRRCRAFGARQTVSCEAFRETAGRGLVLFLQQGTAAAGKSLPVTFINCRVEELRALADEFGLDPEMLPEDVARHCCEER